MLGESNDTARHSMTESNRTRNGRMPRGMLRSPEPDTRVDRFVEDLQAAEDCDALWSICVSHFRAFGIDSLIYVCVRPDAPHDAGVARSTLPDWWTDHYLSETQIADDPLLKHCESFEPRLTGIEYLDLYPALPGPARRRLQDMNEAGLSSGFTSPVRLGSNRRCGGWTFGTHLPRRRFDKLYDEVALPVRLMGFYAHERLDAFARRPETAGTALSGRLSARECMCLTLLAKGSRTAQIARSIGIAPITVEFHLKNARRKLGAATREEALARALVQGDIVLDSAAMPGRATDRPAAVDLSVVN